MAGGGGVSGARAECPLGDWMSCLEMTGVHERQARRLMQLARSGLTADTVSELGGIKAALAHLAEQKRSEPGSWEWCKRIVNGPFLVWDREVEDAPWLVSKVMRRAVHRRQRHRHLAGDEFKLPVLPLVSAWERRQGLLRHRPTPTPILEGRDPTPPPKNARSAGVSMPPLAQVDRRASENISPLQTLPRSRSVTSQPGSTCLPATPGTFSSVGTCSWS